MFRRLLREYLSFTTGERRGLLILASMVLAVLLFRMTLPELLRPSHRKAAVRQASPAGRPASSYQKMPPDQIASTVPRQDPVRAYFYFDPNNAGLDTLIGMGLSPGTARTLVRYREQGGRFRKKEDLLKIYGLEEKDYLLLEPWISIQDSTASAAEIFDLNRADTSLLMSVRGIGPVFSRRIIKFRELLGGFHSLDQLHEVYGLSDEQFHALSLSCYADSSRIRMLDLNSADREELEKHPYLDAYQASALLFYRGQTGGFTSLDEIRKNNLLPPGVLIRISPYLKLAR